MGSGSEKPRESRSPVHDVVDFPVRSALRAKRPPRPFLRQPSRVVLEQAPRHSASERTVPVSHNRGRLVSRVFAAALEFVFSTPGAVGQKGPRLEALKLISSMRCSLRIVLSALSRVISNSRSSQGASRLMIASLSVVGSTSPAAIRHRNATRSMPSRRSSTSVNKITSASRWSGAPVLSK